jgi:hypothetical protein
LEYVFASLTDVPKALATSLAPVAHPYPKAAKAPATTSQRYSGIATDILAEFT